ncbi:hypothetical protein L7F22_057473 [Adiantum nelumboides]|nr:hypothetical protein [Adiantum nelumboides]
MHGAPFFVLLPVEGGSQQAGVSSEDALASCAEYARVGEHGVLSSSSERAFFVGDPPNSNDVSPNGSLKVENDLHPFLNEHAEIFINDILSELPLKRGDDDHKIDLIPESSPPNKPPYRVSQAQQEEIMSQVNELVQKEEGDLENKMGEPSSSWQNFNFRDDEGSAQGMQALRLLLAKLQEAQANPRLKPSVNNLLMTEDLMLTSTQRLPSSVAPMHLEGGEGVPVMHGPMQANVVPHPLQGPLQTDGAKKKQYHGQEKHVGKIREEGDFHDDDDEPPSRSRHKKRTNERRTKRSRRNSSGGSSSSSQSGRSSHGRFPKKGRKSPTPPTSPSSSPRGESSSEESSSTYKGRHPRRKHHAWKRAKKLKKFKEGGKSIIFQTFDGSYGHVDKVLTFIQQFDAAFGGEDFTEASKLRNVAMHLTKSARHWWSTLCAKNQAPKTWKVCRLTIMKQFLDDDAEDNVLTAWRSLKFKEGESLQNYIEKFWDTCLKATVYRNIKFSEKRQQFCAGLPEDMRTYVQALRPKTIAAVIHYTRVAYKIFKPKNPPNKGDKGKDKENGSSNVKSNNKKQASKRPYQGTNRLSPEEMERYRKENRCFRCGTTD